MQEKLVQDEEGNGCGRRRNAAAPDAGGATVTRSVRDHELAHDTVPVLTRRTAEEREHRHAPDMLCVSVGSGHV